MIKKYLTKFLLFCSIVALGSCDNGGNGGNLPDIDGQTYTVLYSKCTGGTGGVINQNYNHVDEVKFNAATDGSRASIEFVLDEQYKTRESITSFVYEEVSKNAPETKHISANNTDVDTSFGYYKFSSVSSHLAGTNYIIASFTVIGEKTYRLSASMYYGNLDSYVSVQIFCYQEFEADNQIDLDFIKAKEYKPTINHNEGNYFHTKDVCKVVFKESSEGIYYFAYNTYTNPDQWDNASKLYYTVANVQIKENQAILRYNENATTAGHIDMAILFNMSQKGFTLLEVKNDVISTVMYLAVI